MTLRLLVVDDEPDVLLLQRHQLGLRDDVEVVGTARDGEAALEAAERLRPDVVVMDLLMPGMNGFQAITELRDLLPGVRIIAYTGVAGDFVRDEMGRLGVPLVLKDGTGERLAEVLDSMR